MKHTFSLFLLTLGLLAGPTASAYFSPEEVLLNKEFFLPPTNRDTQDRIDRQQRESAVRRDREQEILFRDQREEEVIPAIEPPEEDHGAARAIDPENLSASDMELLRTIRLLTRINTRQENVLQYGQRYPGDTQGLHAGAPLTDTGPGAIILATAMGGSVLWTLKRARKVRAIQL